MLRSFASYEGALQKMSQIRKFHVCKGLRFFKNTYVVFTAFNKFSSVVFLSAVIHPGRGLVEYKAFQLYSMM